MSASRPSFVLLVYHMPTRPTTHRVAVWRQLKKLGAVYLQQSVCAFVDTAAIRRDLAPILERIRSGGGEFYLLPLGRLGQEEERKLVDEFNSQATKHYAEIIENCEVNFQKEIEFEIFRENFTYEEAEEIRAEYEKICLWFERVKARDWFGAPNRNEAKAWLDRCETLLEEFEARVYELQQGEKVATTSRKRRGRRPLRVVPDAEPPGDAVSP